MTTDRTNENVCSRFAHNGEPRLIFEQVRALWPRHPELVADVCACIGWRETAGDRADHHVRTAAKLRLSNTADALLGDKMRERDQGLPAPTFEDLRDAGISFRQMMWLVSTLASTDADMGRRLRLWTADCVTRVLYVFEEAHPTDMRVRDAIQAARRFARGEIDTTEDAEKGALAAHSVARRISAGLVASAASYLTRERDSWAANVAAKAARAAVSCGPAARQDATEVESAWQLDRLIARMSSREPVDWPLPAVPHGATSAGPGGRPKIVSQIPARLHHFADRTGELAQLHRLSAVETASASTPPVVIRGGVGKTELAIEYAYRYGGSYAGVWFAAADNRLSLVHSLAALAARLHPAPAAQVDCEAAAKARLRSLAGCEPPLLMICDHVANPQILNGLLPSDGVRLIVTTGREEWAGAAELVLPDLRTAAAIEFLQRAAGINDQSGATQIVSLEGTNPVVLESIARDCRADGMSFRRWLEMDAAHMLSCNRQRPR